MRAASSALSLVWSLLALGCAGGKAAVVGSSSNERARETAPDQPISDAAAPDAALGAEQDRATAELAPPAVDPAVSNALLAKSGDGNNAAPLGLRFEVVELGSELPWGFTVVNRGTEAAVVDFDPRLLTLEIAPPEVIAAPNPKRSYKPKPKKAKPVLCRLPSDVAPAEVDPALAVKLEPGSGLVESFDPRLYCVGKAPWPLVQGAVVTPRLGWPEAMKVSWHGGKREEKPGVQKDPFIAEPIEASGSLPGNGLTEVNERRVKQLVGSPLSLGADFSNVPPPPHAANGRDAPALELTIAGGDATNEGAAVATTTITNRGGKKQDLYFRRELVSYEVSGPDGVFECDPEPDMRSPVDRSAILTLRPGAKFSAVTRLIEMCPGHAFARPGLYLVHARFDSADSGADLGYQAFMGRLLSLKPALVRIREGELPFTPLSNAVRVQVGQ